MATFVQIYLLAVLGAGVLLYAWVVAAEVRRHGFRRAAGGFAREFARDLPLSPRAPVLAWTFVVGLPVVAAWTVVRGDRASDLVWMALLWLAWLALLVWHRRAKRSRARRIGA